MIKFQLFSPHRLIFEKPAEGSEDLPDANLSDFTYQCSGNICDILIGENEGEKNEIANEVQTFEKLKANFGELIQTEGFGVFRTGALEGEYLIISERDGETIGKVNVVMVNGTPAIEATQYIPIYTPDLKGYTYEEKTTYYKSVAQFKADLGIFTEDLRA